MKQSGDNDTVDQHHFLSMDMDEDSSDDGLAKDLPGNGQSEAEESGTTLQELFKWPQAYAEQILSSARSRQRFRQLMKYNINHHESFAGTGSAGISLHMLHKAFISQCATMEESTSFPALALYYIVCVLLILILATFQVGSSIG